MEFAKNIYDLKGKTILDMKMGQFSNEAVFVTQNDKRRTESMAQRKGVIACIISIGSERKNYTTVN